MMAYLATRVLSIFYWVCKMATSNLSISVEEFKMFHLIDRKLYSFLVMNLWRDPVESMQIMGLWLWLERKGFNNVVKKILSLPCILINEVADEAIICLNCINNDPFICENSDIPLIQSLMEKEISLKYIHDQRLSATQGVAKIVHEVCIRALSDIMQQAIERSNTQNLVSSPNYRNNATISIGVPPEERTMFVTFSKGYPVHEWEVREFLTRSYGDCIESLHMQEVELHEQALFARIVFQSVSTIQVILNGMDKAKFNINGKHVWARKFVPKKRPKSSLSSFSSFSNFPSPFRI